MQFVRIKGKKWDDGNWRDHESEIIVPVNAIRSMYHNMKRGVVLQDPSNPDETVTYLLTEKSYDRLVEFLLNGVTEQEENLEVAELKSMIRSLSDRLNQNPIASLEI